MLIGRRDEAWGAWFRAVSYARWVSAAWHAAAWTLFGLSLLLMFVGPFAFRRSEVNVMTSLFSGAILLWVVMIFAAVRPRPLYAIKMDKHYVWLTKVSPELIKEFPQAPAHTAARLTSPVVGPATNR